MRLHAKKGHRTLYAEMGPADHFAIKCPMGLAAAKASLYSKIVLQTDMHTCMYACIHECMHACMHVCLHAYMHQNATCMHGVYVGSTFIELMLSTR